MAEPAQYRQAWSIVVARFLTDPIWWFFLIWLPDYFKKTRHLDIQHSWIHLATIYAIVTVLSNIGGWLPGYLMKQGWSVTRARKSSMFPKNAVASLIGIGSAAGSTGGIIFPIVTGQLLDKFQAAGNITDFRRMTNEA